MSPARPRPRFEPLRSATPPSGAQNADHSLEPVVSFSMSPLVPFRMSFDSCKASSDLRPGRDPKRSRPKRGGTGWSPLSTGSGEIALDRFGAVEANPAMMDEKGPTILKLIIGAALP